MPKRLVYVDNAATTPVRPEVLEAMLPYLGREAFGNPSSAHRFGRTARAGLEEAKRSVAECLGVEPGQVIFTSGGTEADNLAIIGSALAARAAGGALPGGGRVVAPRRRAGAREGGPGAQRGGGRAGRGRGAQARRGERPRRPPRARSPAGGGGHHRPAIAVRHPSGDGK